MPKGESSSGNRNSAASHLPVLVDPRLVKALDHILRQHILLAAVAGEISPNELSKALDEELSQVSYHVKVLRDDCDGMIEETRTEPRRGAVEHYYRASAKTLFPAKAWRRLKKGSARRGRRGSGKRPVQRLGGSPEGGQAARSARSDHPHSTRPRRRGEAQRAGHRRASDQGSRKRAGGDGQAHQRRPKATVGEVVGYTFALLAFEAAWEPADLHALVSQAERGRARRRTGQTAPVETAAGARGTRRQARAAGK